MKDPGNDIQIPTVNVFWTGGFDSTCRMMQLSKIGVTVQPYYLRDRRRSERNELAAISAISRDILKHPDTRFTLLPLIAMAVRDIPPDSEISEAYGRLKEATLIGKQYEWLSRFSKTVPGVELSIESSDPGRTVTQGGTYCIMKHGALKFQEDVSGATFYVVDNERSSQDLIKVFGNFRFPIIKITKREMVEEYKRLDFESSMHKTWFCYKPVKNSPCGRCVPCVAAIDEGMQFRFSKTALDRYRFRSKYLYLLSRLGVIEILLSLLSELGMSETVENIRGKIRQLPGSAHQNDFAKI